MRGAIEFKRVAALGCLIFAGSLLSACDTVEVDPPSVASLSAGESFDHDGIRSVHDGYAVYIEKVNAPDSGMAPLAQYGLPLKVVVANLGDTPISFGPAQVVVKRNGQPLSLLDEQKIKDIKDEERSRAETSANFAKGLAMFAGALAPIAAQQGQISSTQATLYGLESKVEVAQADSDIAETHARITTESDALVRANKGIALTEGPVPAHGFGGGMVLVSDAKPSDALEIDVTTGGAKHVFVFTAPAPTIPSPAPSVPPSKTAGI